MKTKQTANESGLYTSTQTRKKLGISPSTLKNLVEKGVIEKVVPVGYEHGYYTKSSVDAYYEQKRLFNRTYLLEEGQPDQQEAETPSEGPRGDQQAGKDASRPVFQLATAEDMEAVYELSQRAINKITPDAEVRRVWVTKNPEDSFVVKHHGKVVAFFHLLPVKHERLKEFMEGKIRGWEIGAQDIEAFEPNKPLECLVIIASEQETDEITRMNYARLLMRGTMQVLGELGRRGITFTKFYATSETPTGIALSLHAGMRELDYRLGKRLAFEMDIEKTDSRLLKFYKKGLTEWKKEQDKQAKKRAS